MIFFHFLRFDVEAIVIDRIAFGRARIRNAVLVGAIAVAILSSSADARRAFCLCSHPTPRCRPHLVALFDASHAVVATSDARFAHPPAG